MILQGISGMNMGDGQGGKIALDIDTKILRILADGSLSFRTATIFNAEEVRTGSVFFATPEVLQVEDYGTGTNATATVQSGGVTVNINIRDDVKFEYESFDFTRLGRMEEVVGYVAASLANSIEAQLEAHFLNFLVSQFETGGALENANQSITLTNLAKQQTQFTQAISDNLFVDYMNVEYLINTIATKYDKRHLGVSKDEIISVVAPIVDINLRVAFRNQPNQLGEWQISPTLVGRKIGNWKYQTSSLLLQQLAADKSFNKGRAYDFTKYAGFILHNESVAMPMNYNSTQMVLSPVNANPIFITKFQFGLGLLRPQLVYALKKDTTTK